MHDAATVRVAERVTYGEESNEQLAAALRRAKHFHLVYRQRLA